MRIVFVRIRSLGDTVLTTPALEITRREGEHEIGVVIERPFDSILRGRPDVDRLFVIAGRLRWLARLRTILQLRAFHPDLVIDLHGGTTSSLITALSGAKRRIGYRSSRNRRLYNETIPDPGELWGRSHLHTVEHLVAPLITLGFKVQPIPAPSLQLERETVIRSREKLKKLGIESDFVLIHPAAALATKQWAVKKFSCLALGLLNDGLNVVATAGPGQSGLLTQLKEMAGGDVLLVPPMPLREFSGLVSLCRVYVGNDTGPTHVAAALGRKIVVVFGSSNATAWRPWATDYRLLQSDRSCIPCPGYDCLHYSQPRCIQEVEPEEVRHAVNELW